MKYRIAFVSFLLCGLVTYGQLPPQQPHYPDSLFSTYYHQRVSLFRLLPQTNEDIIFLGNSITDGGEWSELFADNRIKNRGISGDITTGVLNRLDEVYDRKPAKVFLLIGTNDLARNTPPDTVIQHIAQIATLLHVYSPRTKLYVQSIFPVNERFGKFTGHTSKKKEILEVNDQLRRLAPEYHYQYIDVFAGLADSTGRLDAVYTNDGLHLTGAGYLRWKEVISQQLYNYPALLPMPAKVEWVNEKANLPRFNSIVSADPVLSREAERLKKIFSRYNPFLKIIRNNSNADNQLLLERTTAITQEEGYQLLVTPDRDPLPYSCRCILCDTNIGAVDQRQTNPMCRYQ